MLVDEFAGQIHATKAQELLEEIRSTFELGYEIKEFIGSHPVPLSLETIEVLLMEDYLVCEKTDGIRLMMFIIDGIIYFYDRKNKLYQTDLIFKGPFKFLFDGEMYLEKDSYIFAMFDCLIYDSKPRIEVDLNKRLWYCFEFEKVVQKGFIRRKNDSPYKPFHIIGKQMFKSYSFTHVLDAIPTLHHENDGLIFTPVNEPYLLGSRSKIFKWKPPHLNTVDFLVRKTAMPGVFSLMCALSADQIGIYDHRRMSDALIFFDYYFEDEEPVEIDNRIGEFSYDSQKEVIDVDDLGSVKGGWRLHRIRSDKNTPNNIKIVSDTVDSLETSVRVEDLRKCQEEMRRNYKERESGEVKRRV